MKQKGSALIIILILILLVIISFFVYKDYLSPKGTILGPFVPSPTATADPTASWKTYSDPKYNYSFKYPVRYEIEKPTQEALPEGEVGFNAGSKGDRFWIDAVSFDGTLDQFVSKYTAYDSVPKVVMTNSNVNTPLGELINQSNNAVRLYKYINHYDQNINPGAEDIITYTGFIVSNNFGYILRSANVADNFTEVNQILSTFKFTDSATSGPEVTSPVSNSKVVNPLTVIGTVPAGWMFEGVFPIKLVDANRKLIVQGQAKETVAGSWQSGNPVDFTATLTFNNTSGSGFLILQNDNPSGDPVNSKTFEVPVSF
jgi:hypothetical protein